MKILTIPSWSPSCIN